MKYLSLFTFIIVATLGYSQNIGVGTIEPKARLHVAGQIKADSSLVLDTIALPASGFINVPKEAGFVWITNEPGYQENQMMMNGISKIGQILFVYNEDDDTVFFHEKIISPRSTSLFIHEGMSWLQITDKNASSMLSDANGDTKVYVEKYDDEDKIRFEIGGDSAFIFDKTKHGYNRITIIENDRNIFLGKNTGDSLQINRRNNGNVVVGNDAFTKNTEGYSNVALGNLTLRKDTLGVGNTALGHGAGYEFQGQESTFIGWGAGSLSSGNRNTALGVGALENLNSGEYNNIIGYEAARFLEKGHKNNIIGDDAAISSDSLNSSILIGSAAGKSANGNYHIFIGDSAGLNNNWHKDGNVFIGRKSGARNDRGGFNTYVGNLAGSNTLKPKMNNGDENSLFGYTAGANMKGNGNTFLGSFSGVNVDGSSNLFAGASAGEHVKFSLSSIILGAGSGFSVDTFISSIVIGNDAAGRSVSMKQNVLIGTNAGHLSSGKENVMIGAKAGRYIVNNTYDGSNNVFIGNEAAQYGSSSSRNIVIGNRASGSRNAVLGDKNTILGNKAAYSCSNANSSLFMGHKSGYEADGTTQSVFIGNESGFSASSANGIFIGFQCGYNSSGEGNNFLGYKSGYQNTSGSQNLFIGTQSGENNTTASNNIAFGYRSAYSNETGGSNIALGTDALFRNLSGSRNIAIGDSAGFNNRSVVGKNIFIGHGAGMNELGKNKLIIENSDSRNPLIFGDFKNDILTLSADVNTKDLAPIINNRYNLGNAVYKWRAIYALNGTIQTSDIRQKKNIQNLTYGLNEVMSMRSVSYEWKHDTIGQTKVGFIAQELEQIIPEVVVVGNDSLQTRGVNYAELIPVLVNAIKEQQALINKLEVDNTAKDNDLQLVNNRMSSLENKLDLLLGSMVKQ